MKRYLWVLVLLWPALQGCSLFEGKEGSANRVYENIAIVSDISWERLEAGVRDTAIIRGILEHLAEAHPSASTVRFSRLNYNLTDCVSPVMDLGALSSEEEVLGGIRSFAEGVACQYGIRDEVDLDVASLVAGIATQGDFLKEAYTEGDAVQVSNRLMVFAEGYLDFASHQLGEDFRLGPDELEDIRQRCLASKRAVYDVLRDCPELRIRPIWHPNHEQILLYLLETGDRGGLRPEGDLSDNAILEVLWELWAWESGFKDVTWKSFSRQGDLSASYISNLFDASPVLGAPDMTPYGEEGVCPDPVDRVEEPVPAPEKVLAPRPRRAPVVYEAVAESRIRDYEVARVSSLVREAELLALPDPAAVVKKLPAGTRLEIKGYGGRYYRVVVDGTVGYVREGDVYTYRNKKNVSIK
ncbi:MAG: hypothetical protein NWR67_11620 [Saprospiraceae bacterium]|nr:hypothetical protein [Saprospiraceae bacterium]